MSAPVGQACTHSPQATQVEEPIGSSKSKTIFSRCPRAAMPMTSLTWTSRQARTQRLQWMQASSCTAIAGWLKSSALFGRSIAGKRLSVDGDAVGPAPESGVRVVRGRALGLVGDEELEDELARALGALACGLDLHARRRPAHAGGGEHALALDLDHAGAAIAVGPVAGRRRVAQMRDVGAVAARHLPDGLARPRLDLAPVEDELDAFDDRQSVGHGSALSQHCHGRP